MKRLRCRCGNRVFFENRHCLACGHALAYAPDRDEMLRRSAPGDPAPGSAEAWSDPWGREGSYRVCVNRTTHDVCNWLAEPDSHHALCPSCRLNRTIPNLSVPENRDRWRVLEGAKRRTLRQLLLLGLYDPARAPEGPRFAFIEDRRTNPDVAEEFVTTGHSSGLITIHAGEGDPVFREAMRTSMRQPYRTPLGHLRHELGHFYWERLIGASPELLERFRSLFGDERTDYQRALERFYAELPAWPTAGPGFISSYAQAHPAEDWAECFAHFLHILDALESGAAEGYVLRAAVLPGLPALPAGRSWLAVWRRLTVGLNELNRALGLDDPYPFAIDPVVEEKLCLVRDSVARASGS